MWYIFIALLGIFFETINEQDPLQVHITKMKIMWWNILFNNNDMIVNQIKF